MESKKIDNQMENLWNNQNQGDYTIPENFEKNAISNPVEKIKKNIKQEFIVVAASILILVMIPFFGPYKVLQEKYYYEIITIFALVIFYYFRKFYLIYKEIDTKNYQLRYNLQSIFYESKLFVELYKSANYVFAIIALLLGYKIVYHMPENIVTGMIKNILETPYGPLAIVIGFLVGVELFVKAWVYYYYERSINDIKKVLDNLDETV